MSITVVGNRRYRRNISAYHTQVMADSPKVYYPLDTSAPVDYTGASALTDAKGVWYGFPGIGDGLSCISVGGVSGDGTYTANMSAMDGATALTLECIAIPDVVNVAQAVVALENSSSSMAVLQISAAAKAELIIWTGGGTVSATGATSLVAGQVYHLAGVWTGTTALVYVNGVQDATAAVSTIQSSNSKRVCIGRRTITSNAPFKGRLAGVAVYSSALSATRLLAHSAAKQPADRSGLIAGEYTPDALTTGVVPGTARENYTVPGDGLWRITTPGTIVSNLNVTGSIKPEAQGIILRNLDVTGRPSDAAPVAANTYKPVIDMASSAANGTLIEDCTIHSNDPSAQQYGIKGGGFTARRCNIYGTVDGIQGHTRPIRVENSYIHDLLFIPDDPNQGPEGSHTDGIQFQGGTSCYIEGTHINVEDLWNTTSISSLLCVLVTSDAGTPTSFTMTKSFLVGGSIPFNKAGARPTTSFELSLNKIKIGQKIYGTSTRYHATIDSTTRNWSNSTITGNVDLTDGVSPIIITG